MRKAKMEDGGWKMERREGNGRIALKSCRRRGVPLAEASPTFFRFFVCFVSFVVNPLSAQPAPEPELERSSFQVSPGFEVSLWAADPMLAKPIQMNFDPRGRLWVATSEIYPQIKP